MSLPRFLPFLAAAALAAAGTAAAAPGRNLTAIEFVDSPPTGLEVSGGLLGVPDSAGVFPTPYRRNDPLTGQHADPGAGFGNVLVFRDLAPGAYRVAMVFLQESKLTTRLLPKNRGNTDERCMVYGDSLPALTFTVVEGEARFLGRITRKERPSLGGDSTELWRTSLEWSAGDESKILKGLAKRKELADWKPLIQSRMAKLESGTSGGR